MEAHHLVNGSNTGINSGGRQIRKNFHSCWRNKFILNLKNAAAGWCRRQSSYLLGAKYLNLFFKTWTCELFSFGKIHYLAGLNESLFMNKFFFFTTIKAFRFAMNLKAEGLYFCSTHGIQNIYVKEYIAFVYILLLAPWTITWHIMAALTPLSPSSLQ